MTTRDGHHARARSHPTAVLAIILVSYLMIVLDISVVITALPQIRDDLDFSTASLSWVQSAYTLVFGGLLLLGARAGDILGRRAVAAYGAVAGIGAGTSRPPSPPAVSCSPLALATVLTLIARRTPARAPSLRQQPRPALTTASTSDAQP